MARKALATNRRPNTVKAIPPSVIEVGTDADVTFMRQELRDKLEQYELIDDAVKGGIAVKAKGEVYLPRPDAADRSPENFERYMAYKKRALFYNVTKRTLSGLVGQIFLADPIIEVPNIIDPVVKDANGSGVSLIQLAEQAHRFVTSKGRAGLLADFPEMPNGANRAQVLSGEAQGTISLYAPEDIINWRVGSIGRTKFLSLVVLRESYTAEDDGFKIKNATQYRVLRIVDGYYVHQVYRPLGDVDGAKFRLHTSVQPTVYNGDRMKEIPFTFLGAVDNDEVIDEPPMYDLADVNIAHYRNSADYEENIFLTGQPTPYFTGLTEHWVNKVLGGRVAFGARVSIPLPVGASAGMLSVPSNGVVHEAMEAKERQMVALGAKLVEQQKTQRTAKEASMENASEQSMLTTITKNVSAGFKWCLEWCAIYVGATTVAKDARDKSVKFELSTDFDLSTASPEEVKAVIQAWKDEAIAFTEMRAKLRKARMATKDDEEAKAEIQKDAEAFEKRQRDLFEATHDDNDDDENGVLNDDE